MTLQLLSPRQALRFLLVRFDALHIASRVLLLMLQYERIPAERVQQRRVTLQLFDSRLQLTVAAHQASRLEL